MQRSRDQLLPRPRLSGHERGAHVRCESADQGEQLVHDWSAADHAAELESTRELTLNPEHASTTFDVVANVGQQSLETGEIERFAQIVRSAELDRFDGAVHRGTV